MNGKINCSDDLKLAAYLDGRLSAGEKEAIERQLSERPECRDTANMIRTVLGSDEALVPSAVPERLVRNAIAMHPGNRDALDLVLALAGNALSVVRAALNVQIDFPFPAAALRSNPPRDMALVVMTKTFDAVTAEVNIEKLAGRICNILVAVRDTKTRTPMENMRIELVSEGRELGSSRLAQGRVLFEDVGLGRYDIVIRRNSAEFGTMAIKIQ